MLLTFFVAYLLVLSWADYSYVQPASSISYVLIALLAHFVLHEDDHAAALGRRGADLHGSFCRGTHAAAYDGALAVVTKFILLSADCFRGTGGELCVSRAMKTVGEVTDFRPRAIARVVGRAMMRSEMWIGHVADGTGVLRAAGNAFVAKVSFVFPSTALSYAVGRWGGSFSWANA